MSNVKRHAELIGANANAYGFPRDVMTLIAERALPNLLECWMQGLSLPASAADQSVHLKTIAESNWSPSEVRYSPEILDRMRMPIYRVVIVKCRSIPTVDECNQVSAAILDYMRRLDVVEVADLISEVQVEKGVKLCV